MNQERRWRSDARYSFILKGAAMLPSAIAGLLATSAVARIFGAEGLALFAVIASLPALLPFADFGLGAGVTTAVSVRAAGGVADPGVVLRMALLRLSVVGVVLVGLAVGFWFGNIWPLLIGIYSLEASLAATWIVVLFGLSLPLSLGYRVLLGLQRNSNVVFLQSLFGIIGYLCVSLASIARIELPLVVVLPSVFGAVAAAVGLAIAYRALRISSATWPTLQSRISAHGGFGYAAPFFVIALSAPIAFQSDRVMLSQISGVEEVASYGVAFLIFSPFYTLIITVGQTLWPRYIAIRESNPEDRGRIVFRSVATFFLFGLGAAVVLGLLGPVAGDLVAGGSVDVTSDVYWALSLVLLFSAVAQPLNNLMLADGFRWALATMATVNAGIKISLALALVPILGDAGTALATSVSLLIAIVLPGALWLRRVRRVGEAD